MFKISAAALLFCHQDLDFGYSISCFSFYLMMLMALLRSGVVAKLLDAMKDDGATSSGRDDRKLVLLQIRSIIPVLEEGDLWPNRGFYLKVSDRSQAIYVSLPQEQNDMILSNKLKIGQFIYVQKLEKADPVPLLRGLILVPGRRLCEGSPEDIDSPRSLMKFLQSLDTESVVEEKGVISEKKVNGNLSIGFSDSDALVTNRVEFQIKPKGRFRSLSPSKIRPGLKKMRSHSSLPPTADDDSDSDSTMSSVSSISKRKSWTQSEIVEMKEIFDSSVEPKASSGCATVSPVRSLKYDSSDECSNSFASRIDVSSAKKSIKGTKSVKNRFPKVISGQTLHHLSSLIYDPKGAETAIPWGSLPPILAKLGKEVVRHRDVALSAAADALQEASAAERLLRSISKYSELKASEGADMQLYVDKCFDLQDDLALTKLIMQSLTSISPFKTSETDANGTPPVKEARDIAVERKKNATKWIKSAMALDLSTSSGESLNPNATPAAAINNTALRELSRSIKPKGASTIKKQRSLDEIPRFLGCDKDNNAEWMRGSSLSAANDLAPSLQDECRKLFLDHVEKYLDEFESKALSAQHSESQIAAMMFQVKKVNDWLVLHAGKEPNFSLDDSEREAYERLKNKIYGILLMHVERTTSLWKSRVLILLKPARQKV